VLTNEAIGLASDFDHYDDFVDQPEPHRKVYERNAQRTTDAVLRWLAASRDLARPLFLWVHYIDPHGPYHPPDSWPRSFTHAEPRPINVANILEYQREPGLTDGLEYVDRYDEEVAYVDHEIGRLIDGYAERHRADEALIVFTADHGESMMEHQRWFTHGYHVYEEIARVPLMVRGPGVTVRRFEEPVSGVDVAPTILRFVGRAVPEWMSAVDLRSGKGLDGTREVFIEATVGPEQQWRAVVQGRRKWMVSVRSFGPVPSAQRVYDLAADPRELTPRPWEALAEPARHLLELCRTDPDPAGVPRQYAKGIQLSAPKVAPGLPAETRARLKALGYAE
jgi:arylsulfatase